MQHCRCCYAFIYMSALSTLKVLLSPVSANKPLGLHTYFCPDYVLRQHIMYILKRNGLSKPSSASATGSFH